MMTNEQVRELFDYRDGSLYWRKRVNSKVAAGSKAGTVNGQGYVVITLAGKKVQAHRLIWQWHGMELPEQIDHVSGDRADNRLENLRAAKVRTDNASGVKNVSWCNTYSKWVVQILHRGGKVTGRFRELEEAIEFAAAKRAEVHGDFAFDGRR